MNILKRKYDIAFGTQKEITLQDRISNYLGERIIRSEDKFSPNDYYNDNCVLELKSRRNTKYKYDTTMITLSKVNKMRLKSPNVYLFFNFTDKLCCVKLEDISRWEVRLGGRRDRGIIEEQLYLYIPVKDLIDI